MRNLIATSPEENVGSAEHRLYRPAAFLSIAGAGCMIVGAVLWQAAGADLDSALADDAMAAYLKTASEVSGLLVANLTMWIVGVLLLGAAGTLISRLESSSMTAALVARMCFGTAVPLAIVAFVAWLALVMNMAVRSAPATVATAELIGWFASRADWIATVLIVGAGPALLSVAGRGAWAPGWLSWWGIAAAGAGALSTISLFTGGITTYGFLIVPIGLGWMLAAGFTLHSRSNP